MKRLPVLFLALLMLFSLSACGKSDSGASGGGSSNSYATPVKTMEKYDGAKEYDYIRYIGDLFNGADGGYAVKMLKIRAKGQFGQDRIGAIENNRRNRYADMLDEFGSNFKIKYKIDKDLSEKLDKERLEAYREDILSRADSLFDAVEDYHELFSSEKEEVAERWGISLDDLDRIAEYMEALGKELEGARVDAGYKLKVIRTITGRALDEPEEDEFEMIVLKVNGRWVSYSALMGLSSYLLF